MPAGAWTLPLCYNLLQHRLAFFSRVWRSMNRDVRKLTDGAMMTAIVGVLLVVNRQLGGLLESMVLFLFPIPMVFYSARYGWKDSWLPYAAMVILAFVLGTPQTVFYVASESMMGMVYGSGIYAKKELRKLVIVTMLIGVAVDLLSTVIFAAFFGYDLTADTAAMTTQMNQIMSQAGVSLPATVDLTQLIKTVIILSAVLSGILEALVTHLLSLLLLKRMRYNVPKATPIALYFPPLWSGYAGLAGLVAYYYTIYHPLAVEFWQIAVSGSGIAGFFYLVIYGMIAMAVFGTLANPKMKWLYILMGIFMMMSAPQVLAIVGFLYITTGLHAKLLKGGSNARENG